MSRVVHIRLDPPTEAILERLTRETGRSPSELVRESLLQMARATPAAETPEIEGLGAFASGKRDLGSNKQHLRGFGR